MAYFKCAWCLHDYVCIRDYTYRTPFIREHHNLCYSNSYFSASDHKSCESRCYHNNIIPLQRTLLLAVIHLSMSLKIVKEYFPCMFMCFVAMKVVLRRLTTLVWRRVFQLVLVWEWFSFSSSLSMQLPFGESSACSEWLLW